METITTTISPEHQYLPLTYEEFIDLKNQLSKISNNVPENIAPYLWDNYNRIRAVNQPRPCMCQSAASHWIGCVEFLREWVNSKSI
jgi:hypothetical protein